jgi:hypothetical protein
MKHLYAVAQQAVLRQAHVQQYAHVGTAGCVGSYILVFPGGDGLMGSQHRSSRKPKSQGPKSQGTVLSKREESSRGWLRHPLTIAVVPVVVGAVLAAFHFSVHHRPTSASPRIELDSVQVQPANRAYVSDGGTKSLADKVYFQIRNTGSQLAIIRAVGIQTEYFARIPVCFTQGNLPTTGHYMANLSLHPKLGSVINVPVSQQVPPDSADRFELALRIPPDPDESIYLYRLHLWLFYDNLRVPVDAGQVVVSMPYDPTPQQYVWSRTYQAEHGKPINFTGNDITKISECMISNSKKVRSLLSQPGSRSAGLAGLPSVMSYCCAVRTADEVPLLGVEWGPNQKGYGQPRPTTIFNGGDPTGLVTHIHWLSWGAQTAVGEGTGWYTPGTVANGHKAAARVVAFSLGTCNGYRTYTAIEWYFPQYGESFNPRSYINICTGEYVGDG